MKILSHWCFALLPLAVPAAGCLFDDVIAEVPPSSGDGGVEMSVDSATEASVGRESGPDVSTEAAAPSCSDCTGRCLPGDRCLTTLVSGFWPRAMASDGTNLYWSDSSPTVSTVASVSVNGGTATTLATGDASSGTWGAAQGGLALDDSNVYWVGGNGFLAKVPKAGGTTTTLATWPGTSMDYKGSSAIALDSENVYYGYALTSPSQTSVLASVPQAGGTTTTLASWASPPPATDQPAGVVYAGGTVYWITTEYSPWPIESLVPGGMPTLIAHSDNSNDFIAANDTSVYYTGRKGVMRVQVDGGAPTLIAANGAETHPGGLLLLDDTSIYWQSLGTQSMIAARVIMSAPLSGGTPTTLATVSTEDGPLAGGASPLAIDATSVYWVEGHNIVRLTPK